MRTETLTTLRNDIRAIRLRRGPLRTQGALIRGHFENRLQNIRSGRPANAVPA